MLTRGALNLNSINRPSSWVCFYAESGRVVNVQVSSRSSDSLHVHWHAPTHSNGPVQLYLMRYRLTALGDCRPLEPAPHWSRLLDIDSDQTQTVVTDLRPYSHYQLKIWPRTAAGRGQVAVIVATTAAAGMTTRCVTYLSVIWLFCYCYAVLQIVSSLFLLAEFHHYSIGPLVCPLVTSVYCGKMANSIKLQSRVVGWMGSWSHVLDGGWVSPKGWLELTDDLIDWLIDLRHYSHYRRPRTSGRHSCHHRCCWYDNEIRHIFVCVAVGYVFVVLFDWLIGTDWWFDWLIDWFWLLTDWLFDWRKIWER